MVAYNRATYKMPQASQPLSITLYLHNVHVALELKASKQALINYEQAWQLN